MPVVHDTDDLQDERVPTHWYERPVAVFAAGVASIVALGVLALAVVQTSRHSTAPAGIDLQTTSITTRAPSSTLGSMTTTTIATITETTTESMPASIEPVPTEAPTTEETTTEASTGTTTVPVPYPTTTTVPVAGAY
jgi:hypothetical protein